ncbi:MAG: hypothetical protein AVDCRST_MAG96-4044, partial [uncultured Segetibacter sp.]
MLLALNPVETFHKQADVMVNSFQHL